MTQAMDPFAQESEAEFEVDLTDVKSNFNVDNDDYEMYVVDVIKTMSQANNPMFEWTFKLTGKRGRDKFQTVDNDAAGKDFKMFTALTPQGLWKVGEVTEALGLGEVGAVAKFKRSDAIGLMCIGSIAMEKYKGKDRSSLGSVSPHPGGVRKATPAGVPD